MPNPSDDLPDLACIGDGDFRIAIVKCTVCYVHMYVAKRQSGNETAKVIQGLPDKIRIAIGQSHAEIYIRSGYRFYSLIRFNSRIPCSGLTPNRIMSIAGTIHADTHDDFGYVQSHGEANRAFRSIRQSSVARKMKLKQARKMTLRRVDYLREIIPQRDLPAR
jgi:hypothetical protein